MAFQFVDAFEENVLGFCNNIFTQEGGTHLAGFKTRFTQMINSYAKELGILKEKDTKFTGPDTRNGMTAVVAVKHPDPIFEGQTKTKLASADATKAVFSVTGDELQLYFDRNLEVLKAIIACAEKSAKIRKAEERAKTNMLTKSRFPLTATESWQTVRVARRRNVRFSLSREIPRAVQLRWDETAAIRRSCRSGARF